MGLQCRFTQQPCVSSRRRKAWAIPVVLGSFACLASLQKVWHCTSGAFVNAGTSPTLRGAPISSAVVDVEAPPTSDVVTTMPDDISETAPLRVLVAGGGVGGLALANALSRLPNMDVVVLEKTQKFKRFGGPIQLASNAMMNLRSLDAELFGKIEAKATFTGNLSNGIKDGIRNEWYAMFDLKSPAKERDMPFTCVVERPDLQEIMLGGLSEGVVQNGAGVSSYEHREGGGVTAKLDDGKEVYGDILIGADGIWSSVRATMHGNEPKGATSGATYSGYTVYAGELNYKSFDNGEVGYKVYIGPNQYFVVTDIGHGRYQWYAFLAKPEGSAESEAPLKPAIEVDGCAPGNPAYLREVFEGWSKDIHHIIRATRDDEIQQRDLYDRPPSVTKPWTEGPVALLGDAIHAMMPNLGQGGCQALEDAIVISEELAQLTHRSEIPAALDRYRGRRLVRSAAVQGLSRFASDIIIRGFDTPAKITMDNGLKFENFGYFGIVTRLLQPILPLFFNVQFNFLYNDWRNQFAIDLSTGLALFGFGSVLVLLLSGAFTEGGILATVGLESLVTSAEGSSVIETINAAGSAGVDGML